MLKISLVLLGIILLGLEIILITLLMKYLNIIKSLEKYQILLYEVLLEIQVDLTKFRNGKISGGFEAKNINNEVQRTNEISNIKSSFISKEDLNQLMEGKNSVFKKQVNINPGEILLDNNINI